MITGILVILFWMALVPLCIGLFFTAFLSDKRNVFVKSYLFGLVVYLGLFQVIIVTNMLTVNNFFQVCSFFSCVMVGMAVLGITTAGIVRFKKKGEKPVIQALTDTRKHRVENGILWIGFSVVLVFQLIQTLRLTYPDGDDAYYVGVAAYGVNVPQMYSRVPYTGEYTEFDTRHCLAPFPYVISFLSRMSGVSASTIAHSILPIFFILFAYGIYYLIAKEVCKENREVSLFMLLISVLLLFGNYSVYSMETFLMTRTRQGKASLGSFALPLGFYLLLCVAKEMEGKRKNRVLYYFLLGCNGLVAALFTTMGNFIYPCMIMIGSLCICFGKKEWKKIFPLAMTCVPSVLMALLYLIIK